MTTSLRSPQIRLFKDEQIVVNFAGGGGTCEGLKWALGRSPDVAINHNLEALAMHKRNHPETTHLKTDVFEVDPAVASDGKPIGVAWFSPDCTFFSKARGGVPFRDPQKARRIRGLAWVIVKYARAPLPIKPRIIFVENVEEFQFWGPIGKDGKPDPKKIGRNAKRWEAAIRKEGYVIEKRELRAMHYGSRTSRKRLFYIMRRDGQPIVWPEQLFGPESKATKPAAWDPLPAPRSMREYRSAAECIDFSIPTPSIFMNQEQANAWAKEHGVNAPIRPLVHNTLRRIARGVQKFVLDNPSPFIVNIRHQGGDRAYPLNDPLRTIPASDREFAIVAPVLAPYYTERAEERNARAHSITEPMRTITTEGGGKTALIAATMINTRNGERQGQAPRVIDVDRPFPTVTAQGSQGALVATFLAKHNGGHEATGQQLKFPVDTVTTIDQKALVTSHLVKLYGATEHGADVKSPMPTVTATGNHIAEVRAFLMKFYGSANHGQQLKMPLDTVTTVDRFGLVTVVIAGEQYVIVDIGMRMLSPRELYRAQGFLDTYEIDYGVHPFTLEPIKFTKRTQTKLCGNCVPPHFSAAMAYANTAVHA